MSRPWNAQGPQARLWLLLAPCGAIGLSFNAICEALKEFRRQQLSQALFHMKQTGLVESYSALTPHMWRTLPGCTPPVIMGVGAPAPAASAKAARHAVPPPAAEPFTAPELTPELCGQIATEAAKLLTKHPAGLDSEAIGKALNRDAADVDAALLPAVMDHMLTTCRLVRGERQMVHYRLSAGPVAQYGWREQTRATWSNRQAELMAELDKRERPVIVPAPVPAPAPVVAAASPRPAPKPAPTPPAKHAALHAAEVTSEVLDAAPPAAPPAPGVPFVGELDIDAVHRKRPSAAVSAEEKALLLGSATLDSEFRQATQEVSDAADFLCALYSSGEMLIQSAGGRVQLPLAHTRKLPHYLDHLRGDEFVESVLGELH